MTATSRAIALVLLVVVLTTTAVTAGSRTRTATVSVTMSALAKLSLSRATLSFPDADPDTTPNIPATGGAIGITAKARTTLGSTVTLTVRAANDLKSGTDTIAVTNLEWTGSGSGFVPGTMSATADQTVATWTTSGVFIGSQAYTLVNAWTYPTGSYSTTLTYTLTAP